MYCTQANIRLPNSGVFWKRHDARLARTHCSFSQSSHLHVSSVFASATHEFQLYKAFPRLIYSASKNKKCAPVCVYGGEGNSKSENEAFSWDFLEKTIGRFRREKLLEELLRKQMQELKFNGGGGGRTPPRGGGGGSSGPDAENFGGVLDELLQVILATIGFIFVYIYLVKGKELTMLARDYIRYLLGAKSSPRLRRTIYWMRFRDDITSEEVREEWLQRAILATPTWWLPPWWHTLVDG